MTGSIRPRANRRGRAQALVEAALVIPLLLILVIGVAAVGQLGQADSAVLAVAQEAARVAASADAPAQAIETGVVRGHAVGAGYRLNEQALQVIVDTTDFRRGGQVRAKATYPVSLAGLGLFGDTSIVLAHAHTEPIDPWRNLP